MQKETRRDKKNKRRLKKRRRQKKGPGKLKNEPESVMKSKLVIHRGKEVVQGPEYKRVELMMMKNLGPERLELGSDENLIVRSKKRRSGAVPSGRYKLGSDFRPIIGDLR